MTDYISRNGLLNAFAQAAENRFISPTTLYMIAKEFPAADAIEELSEERDMYIKAMADEHNRAARLAWEHRWIPVTERLPEYMKNVLVTDGVSSGMGWRDWYDYHGTKPREDYWISPNTDVNELNITHWMPLPQPPKEEHDDKA